MSSERGDLLGDLGGNPNLCSCWFRPLDVCVGLHVQLLRRSNGWLRLLDVCAGLHVRLLVRNSCWCSLRLLYLCAGLRVWIPFRNLRGDVADALLEGYADAHYRCSKKGAEKQHKNRLD